MGKLVKLLTLCVCVLETTSAKSYRNSNSLVELQIRKVKDVQVIDSDGRNDALLFGNARLVEADTPKNNNINSIRGGDQSGFTAKNLIGAAFFIAFDIFLSGIFKANNIQIPSMMGGSVLIFIALEIIELVMPGKGDMLFGLLVPGSTLLAKWLPSLFVPGLVMLPLAPKVGSTLEIFKVMMVIVVGFYMSLFATVYSVLGIRIFQGKIVPEIPTKDKKPIGKKIVNTNVAPPKPFSQETVNNMAIGSIVFGALSLLATKKDSVYKTPINTLFMICTTIGSFVYGARLPPSFKQIFHPIVTSTIMTLSLIKVFSENILSIPFEDYLRTYKAGSLSFMEGGAGDFLLHLLGPTVISLAIPMYSRKKLMYENFIAVAAAALVSSAGGLFGTAALGRILKMANNVTRLSVIPRSITTALAIVISDFLGGNLAISASVVVLTGIFGATVAKSSLSSLNIRDPVSRGLAIGSSCFGLGVASLIDEPDALPFAAIAMVLTAVSATCLVSVPSIKNALIDLAVGG
eukprot:CAMPEP_0178945254 /NCGR_PEP_ID=MMETSP0789-20121207/3632_1 /TAXON_ID=3005 /ORGANISM="Rhizosolenia setigera, Strain CCMP 1694" /LENGTH=517 /DNA_ID=CAMNT_0020625123 /DNA_START=37 /DNA_END=1590 /DNA_ORIENTATION=-